MTSDQVDTLGRCENCGVLTPEHELTELEQELLCEPCYDEAELEYEALN